MNPKFILTLSGPDRLGIPFCHFPVTQETRPSQEERIAERRVFLNEKKTVVLH